MTINPRTYDLRELRAMADPDGDRRAGRDRLRNRVESRYTADEVLRARQREELALLATHETAAKPYLSTLPDSYAAEVAVFEWLDYLVNKAGFRATGAALDYYVEIEWLTEAVAEGLRTYMRGFSEVASLDPDGPGPRDLALDDHVLSLIYVARLAALD